MTYSPCVDSPLADARWLRDPRCRYPQTVEERAMEKQSTSNRDEANHGEGNPEAADRFNSAEQNFVNSKRGDRKIHEGAQVRPEEEADLANAEKIGRGHAKE